MFFNEKVNTDINENLKFKNEKKLTFKKIIPYIIFFIIFIIGIILIIIANNL